MLEALRLARQMENAEGVSGDKKGTTVATALYCIDRMAGSVLGSNASGSKSPPGFARVSNPQYGPPKDRNPHAETSIVASIADLVRPDKESKGFVIIFTDNNLRAFCQGYLKDWTAEFEQIPIYVADPGGESVSSAGIMTKL